jgi:hypothetical protein
VDKSGYAPSSAAGVPDYKSRSARDARDIGYGNKAYWDYLERHAHELHAHYTGKGDTVNAERAFTDDLGETLRGNEGD